MLEGTSLLCFICAVVAPDLGSTGYTLIKLVGTGAGEEGVTFSAIADACLCTSLFVTSDEFSAISLKVFRYLISSSASGLLRIFSLFSEWTFCFRLSTDWRSSFSFMLL